MIRSFLKWPGGKARVMPELQKHLPAGDCLVEPFVGGATVFLNTEYRRYVLGDVNPDLINLYRVAVKVPDLLIDAARYLFENCNNEADYYQARKRFNQAKNENFSFSLASEVGRAAHFLFLNRHCYNGVVRYNLRGEFNTPYGKYKGLQFFPELEIRQFVEKARDTKALFLYCSFENTIQVATANPAVIYCDPPYLPITDKASFTEYYGGSFGADRHVQLAADLHSAATNHNCHCVISNSDTPATREIYSQFQMHELAVNRSVSANGINRGAAKEVIGLLPAAANRKEVA